jgi:LysM repeat protein
MLQAPRIVRWTLPALLLTLVIGAVVIVSASRRGSSATGEATGSSTGTTTTRKRSHARHATVRKGDTATAIAHRAKLSLVRLLELNPDVDPRALHTGQKLKISP